MARKWAAASPMWLAITLYLVACANKVSYPTLPVHSSQATPSSTPQFLAYIVLLDEDNATAARMPGFEPFIVSVPTKGALDRVDGLIDPVHPSPLDSVDFEESVVVFLFQGGKGTTGYDVELVSVQVQDHDLVFVSILHTPTPDEPVGATLTSPYVAVSLRRSDIPDDIRQFVLVNSDQVVAALAEPLK